MRYFYALLGLLLIGYLLTGVAQVRPGERAVVRRFGRVLPYKPEPGLWVGLPWGMDQVDRVPVDFVQRVTVGYQPDGDDSSLATPSGQLLTGDQNLVNIQVVIEYSVVYDRVENYLTQADRADGLVARAAESAIGEWVAGRRIDDVLLTGKGQLPGWLVAQVQDRIGAYGLGVQIQQASVAHLLPPDEVKNAFDEVNRSQTEIRTRVNEAEQRAEQQWREAQSECFRLQQTAAAYMREQHVFAQADANAFLRRWRQYKRLCRTNPEILSAIWWDEMGKLLAKMRANGRIELLDDYLGKDGLDITVFPPLQKKR